MPEEGELGVDRVASSPREAFCSCSDGIFASGGIRYNSSDAGDRQMIWDEIVIAAVSVAVSSAVTWYFSRRHYTRVERPISEHDIELERVKGKYRALSWIIGGMVIAVLVALGILAYLAHIST